MSEALMEEEYESVKETPVFEFDAEFQSKIAALTLLDSQFLKRVDGLIKPAYFEDPSEAALASMALRYYKVYRKAPDKSIISRLLKEDIDAKIIRKEAVEAIVERIKSLYTIDISDRDYVVDHVSSFARQQAVTSAIEQAIHRLEKRDYGTIEKVLKEALQVGALEESAGYDFFKERENRTKQRKDAAAGLIKPTGITTGFPALDDRLFQKGWGRQELSVLMGAAKAGKCVRRDTLIFTDDGLAEIGDYVPHSLPVDSFAEHRMKILGMSGVEEVSHVYNSGLSKTLKIETAKGYSVEGTLHHPMLVMTDQGEHVWKRLDEIKMGDWMVVQRGAGVFGSSTDINYAVAAGIARAQSSVRPELVEVPTLPSLMTAELAEFLAMIIAEGYFGERGALSFTQKDESIMSRYVTLCSDLFGITPTITSQEGKTPSARLQSVALAAYLEALGVVWGRSATKVVPRPIMRAPRDCVAAFVSTLIGLECSVHRRTEGKVTFDLVMASKRMIEQLHVLLLNFGIISCKSTKHSMATNGARIVRPYYRLSVSGSRNIALLQQLGVYEERKQNTLAIGGKKDATARDWIIGARGHVLGFMREMQAAGYSLKGNLDPTHWKMARAIAGGKVSGVRELTYSFAETLVAYADKLGFDGESVSWIRSRIAEGYYYDRVVLIEKGEAETVDLTVPGTHSFFANGLVSHNTTAMINFGKNACGKGKNVLYLTLEVAASIIGHRLDASISRTPMMQLGAKIIEVDTKVELFEKHCGKFIIHEYPTGTLRPSELRRLLQWYRGQGMIFDLVIVDYADLMAPDYRTNDAIENSKQIYIDLRAIAQTEDVAVLTATQTNREGAKAATVTATHVAEDFNKVRIADVIISLNRTEEDIAAGQARLYFAASRNQAGGITVVVKQDMESMIYIDSIIDVI